MTDGLELLRLTQSRLGRSMFGHLGLQTQIGLVQFEAQPDRFEKIRLSCVPAKGIAAENHDHRPEGGVGSGALGEKAGRHRQACGEQKGEQGRQVRSR